MKIYMIADVLKIKKHHKFVFHSENKRKEEVWDTSLESEDIYFWHWKACIQYEFEPGNFKKKKISPFELNYLKTLIQS